MALGGLGILGTVIAIVAATVVASPLLARSIRNATGWVLGAVLLVAAGVLSSQWNVVTQGQALSLDWVWVEGLFGGADVMFSLRADGLSYFFALLALGIGGVVLLYSAAYLRNASGLTSFYTLMTAFTLSVLLLVLANDVVVLFIAWELVSLASFMLIARSPAGWAGSMRTLILTFFGGLTLLAALATAAVVAGSTNLAEILASEELAASPGLLTLLAVLIALSAFTKAAQFPFHFWLPEAMAAATPVSAFLHAAAVVKAGIYLLIRFSPLFADVTVWRWMLVIIGMSTAIMSALFAIQKTDLKHITAYSTVSHLGWIVATIGVGTAAALSAAVVHTLAHALFKSSLFMLIGVIEAQAGSRNIRELGRLTDKMPFTFASVLIAAASMAAIPPLFGFVSKEAMLDAFTFNWVVFIAAGFAALLTFIYSAKIVYAAVVDGPADTSQVKEAPVVFWLPAALPGFMSIPVVFALPSLDPLVSVASGHETHLALWHGFNAPLIMSLIVLVLGFISLKYRKEIWARFESKDFLPFTGNSALAGFENLLSRMGRVLSLPASSLNPSLHLVWMVLMVITLGGVVLLGSPGIDGTPMAPRVDGLDNMWDLLPAAIIIFSVIGLALTHSRLTAAVLIGTAGVGMSLQMLMLGAPDVALTQFLVESLTVIVIFLVIRHQSRLFPAVERNRKIFAATVAILAGLVTFAGVFTLLGRRERSDLATWFLENGYDVTGGNNLVAVIIVEFRGFDTLGELSVLGMGAVVLAAVVSSMPRYPFQPGTHPRPFGQSELNSIPLRYGTKLVVPVLVVLSILIFFRGHVAPGGGFVAALVLATAFGLSYMSQGSDKPVVGKRVPIMLTGIGIIVAISAGFLGLLEGGFLYAIHGEILGQHLTTSLIFDGGIYLAVLGMLTMAINALGGYLRPGYELYEDPHDYPIPINPADNPLSVRAATQTKKEDA